MVKVFPMDPKKVYEWARYTMPTVAESLEVASYKDEAGEVIFVLCIETSRGRASYQISREALASALGALDKGPVAAPAAPVAADEPDVG